jgi:tetratricopeptide (TPR) repeat protein
MIGPSVFAQPRPLDRADIYALLATQIIDESSAQFVRHNGVNFTPVTDEIARWRAIGAGEALAKALQDPSSLRIIKTQQTRTLEDPSALRHIERVATLVHRGGKDAWKKADAECRSALQDGPGDARLHYVRGYVLERWNRWKEAEAEYSEAIRIEPQSALALSGLGSVLNQTARPREALEQFQAALRLEPGFVEAHVGSGTASYGLGFTHLGDTQAEYAEAKRLAPHEAIIHTRLCLLWQGMNDLKDAETACKRALECDPSSAEAHTMYGEVLIRESRLLEAYREFQTAIHLDPFLALAHYGLGGVFEAHDCMAAAGAEYHIAYGLNPYDPLIRMNMRRRVNFFSEDEGPCGFP